MNLNNIEECMIIKNYKELCKLLEIPIKTGNTKIKQEKELSEYIEYHKEGHKFIIDKIRDKPLVRKYNNGKERKKFLVKYKNLHINKELYNSIGVYKITLDNDIYIGSTVSGFRKRFMKHRYSDNVLPTKNMLENGAIFEIIEICDGMTEPEIREIENIWIEYYKSKSEWNVINSNHAWSFTEKIKKHTFKNIKIDSEYYDKAVQLLIRNGFEDKIKGEVK